MEYRERGLDKAYELLNCGGLVWVCTKAPAPQGSGRYNLSPVAWSCPLDYEPQTKVLFVCDPRHACHGNILAQGSFALALPTPEQAELVYKTGAVSGKDVDKYESLGIEAFKAELLDLRIPQGVAGWLECRLIRTISEGSVSLVFGEVIRAKAVEDAWKKRLHYVSEGLSYAPGPRLGSSSD